MPGAALADVTGDGLKDAVLLSPGEGLTVQEGVGTSAVIGEKTHSFGFELPATGGRLEARDFDHDGREDLLIRTAPARSRRVDAHAEPLARIRPELSNRADSRPCVRLNRADRICVNVRRFSLVSGPMDERYDPQAVEEKWQERWERLGVNRLSRNDLQSAGDPYYNLMMFPYPSAEGLHIGNIYAYTGADANGRYWRLKGKDVFQPMGFDAFGIHSENYALKVGVNPNDLIPRNVANFTRMLKRFGGMFDWNHTVDTTNPNYYRWTQWVFLKLFEAGLVERRQAPVNWCPSCKTVLANEQVIAGLCERCESRSSSATCRSGSSASRTTPSGCSPTPSASTGPTRPARRR